MTKIKICGLFRYEDIEFVNRAKPDYIGFVFAKNSRRFVSMEFAEKLSKKLNPDIVPVGVFTNADIDAVITLFEKGVIRAAQLHGGESDAYVAELKKKGGDLTVIRAVDANNLNGVTGRGEADFLLLDNGKGGTGKPFDWSKIRGIEPPFFLAGGIDKNNLSDALKLSPYAVDISGGAETDGVKDGEKIIFLTRTVRNGLDVK
jgi:phosphoribosylanthranilate isomerase